MEPPSFPSQDAPTVTAPPPVTLPPVTSPPPLALATIPAEPTTLISQQSKRPVALGMLFVFVAALAIIAVVVNSLSSALGQARVIAYPQPSIDIVFPDSGGTLRVGDQLSFSVDIKAGHDLTVSWDFGDGESAQGDSVTHTYYARGDYTVQATAIDPLGQRASASLPPITILPPPPHAQFSTRTDPNDPFTIDFDANASTGGTALQYNWDFGDGQSDTGDNSPVTTHTYSKLGSYRVTLTVTDEAGQTSDPVTHSVRVTLPKPVASFAWTNDSSCFGWDGVSFDASASTGYQLSYSWDYGDGYTDSGVSTYHYFPYTGNFTVTLTVTDAGGQTATSSQSIYAC